MLNPPPSDDIDTNSFAYKQWFYMLWTSVSTTVVSAANSFIQAGIGAVIRTLQDKAREIVSVKDFGAVGDGIVDDTASIQSAVSTGMNVYFPKGIYKITSGITCATSGQVLYGGGKSSTIISIGASFSLASLGVFIFTSAEPGPELRDIGVTCVQPDSASRAAYTQYPPIVYAQAVPRFVVRNCKFLQCWNGISMRGNAGGATIDGLELFSYNIGIDIDGSLDSVRINRFHWYNFGATANQISVFFNPINTGINSGRCDDLHIIDSLFIGGQGINFYVSGSGSSFGNITNCDFDTNAGILMSGGTISMAAAFFSCKSGSIQAIKMTGGSLRWESGEAQTPSALSLPLIELASVGGSPSLIMGGIIIKSTGDMTAIKVSASAGGANAIINSCRFENTANTSPTNPVVYCPSGRLTFTGNEITDKGTGSGNFVKCDLDDWHVVTDNKFLGWGISYVSPQNNAVINNNGGADGWISYTPTISAGSGAFTTVSASSVYKQIGKTIHFQCSVSITTNGTAAGSLNVTVPKQALSASGGFIFSGRAAAVSGKSLQGYLPTGTSQIVVNNYDNTYPGANGELLVISGTYQSI